MSLLREIQDAAVDSKVEIAVLLRKCKVLAARLGNAEFKQWVEHELNGYPSSKDAPSYRILQVNSKGDFSGYHGSGMKNADIPLRAIPTEFHEYLSHSYFKQPVSALAALIEQSNTGTLQEPWPPDFVAFAGTRIYQHMNCLQAWKVIPCAALVAILDIVRNKVLTFALEIEAESPEAGDAPMNSNPIPQERVTNIYNTHITGNVQNLAAGNERVNQMATHNESSTQLFDELLNAVSKAQADKDAIAKLSGIIEEMRATQKTPSYKMHYSNFMSLLANHAQIFSTVAPYISDISKLIV
jgi:AbiTii